MKKSRFLSRKSCMFCDYTILFVVATVIIFSTFIINRRTLVAVNDGFNSYLPSFIYSGRYLRKLIPTLLSEGRIPLFDFSIGFGDDIPGTLSWGGFGSPFSIISAFTPTRFAAYGLSLTIILQYYTAGLSFLYFCKKMSIKKETSICGALAYAMCGYGLCWGSLFYMFGVVMIYFPLFVLGIRHQIFDNKAYNPIFIISVFLTSLYGFYFLYMCSVFGLIYYCVVFFTKEGRKIKLFFNTAVKLMLQYLIGVFMAGFIIIPSIYCYLHSARSSGNDDIFKYFRQSISLSYIKSQLSMIVMPNYEMGLGLCIITIICIILMFRRKHQYLSLKIMACILCAGYFIPAFGSIMNGFSYSSTRWEYMLYFVLIYATVKIIDDKQELNRGDFISIIVGISVCLLFYILFHDNSAQESQREIALRVIVYFILAAITIFLIAKGGITGNAHSYKSLLGIAIINIILSAFLFFSNVSGGYYFSQGFRGNAIWDLMHSNIATIAAEKTDEDAFSRLDIYDSSLAASLVLNTNTTTSYYSISNGYLYDLYLNALISPGVRGAKFIIKGLDARKSLEMLTSVSSYAEDEKGTEIKKADNVLPMGFAFRRSISDDKAAELSPLTISDIMSDTLVINDVDNKICELNSTKVDVGNRDISIPCELGMSGISWKDKKLKSDRNGKLVCSPNLSVLNKNHEYELYVLLKDFDYCDNATETNIAITGKSIQLKGKSVAYKVDSDDYLVKLNCKGDFDIVFPDAGNFTLDSVSVKAIDITDYDERYETLSQDTLQNAEIGINQVKGTLSAGQDEYLFFSIPYSEGWKCKIDGNNVDVLRADYAFSAVPIKKGSHTVVMYYRPPYLIPAVIMFVIGWSAFIAMTFYKRKDCEDAC